MNIEAQLVVKLSQGDLSDPTRLVSAVLAHLAPLLGTALIPPDMTDAYLTDLLNDAHQRERERCIALVRRALQGMQRYDETVRAPVLAALQSIEEGRMP